MLDLPHHDGSSLYVEGGDPQLGDRVTVWVRVPSASGVSRLHVRTTPDEEPAWADGEVDRIDGDARWWRAEVAVTNPVTNYRFLLDGPGGYRWLTGAGVCDWDPTDATDFRLSAHPGPPAWAQDAVCYQVFPDRFARSAAADGRPLPAWATAAAWDDEVIAGGDRAMRQLYGGDLDGVADKIDHVAELGCDLLYLTPVFPAESNHRYNATSFTRVDPVLGGEEALARLTTAAHARGLRVIGDLTLNHCGDTHEWFRAACADPDAPEAGYFYFDEHPGAYERWLGVPTLPKFDLRSEALRRALVEGPDSVAGRWLSPPFSLDGWRIDVANMAGRLGEVDENAVVARMLARTMREVRPGSLLLAEHAHDATGDLDGSGWHGTMNYAGFTRPAWFWLGQPDERLDLFGMPVPLPRFGGLQAARTLDGFRAAMPWRAWANSLTLLDSHDTARFRSVTGSAEVALVGAAWMFTSPGIPTVFQGDELGLEGFDNEQARVPMPWDGLGWDRTMLEGYRSLIRLRREHVALRRGGFRWVHRGADVLVYLREHADERLLVLLARDRTEPLTVPAAALGTDHLDGLAGPLAGDLDARDGWLRLPADGPAYGVWRL